jgi:hypothetical protein
VRLCLQIHSGSVIATPESLLVSAGEMGMEREQVGANMSVLAKDPLAAAFRLAEAVLNSDFASISPPAKTRRYRSG